MNRLERLRGGNFRLFEHFDLEPGQGVNIVTGGNAQGKTSLLESIFVLGRGRSFRSARLAEIAGNAGERWNVFAQLCREDGTHRLGLGHDGVSMELRIDERRNARVVEATRMMPVQLVDASGHRMLEEGPAWRRAYVDWGVFHVEHRFIDEWRRYQRALKQRNRALKEAQRASAVQAWDAEVAQAGEELHLLRRTHLDTIRPAFLDSCERLLGSRAYRLVLQPGWDEQRGLAAVLRERLEQHRSARMTLHGPHRTELVIGETDERLSGSLSRGQQKLLIAAMVAAQAQAIVQCGGSCPILLVDDFSAELSQDYQLRFAQLLSEYPGQIFVTAFEAPQALADHQAAMFHVEHRRIQRADRRH